jgi:hypothetical protein
MFPPTPVSFLSQPSRARIDTDERRAVLRKLTDALYDYLVLPITEMERAYLADQEARKGPSVTVEKIVHFQEEIEKQRDQLEENRGKVETALHGTPEGMEEIFRVQLEALLVTPLEAQIKGMEQYLSQMQAELEKGTAV